MHGLARANLTCWIHGAVVGGNYCAHTPHPAHVQVCAAAPATPGGAVYRRNSAYAAPHGPPPPTHTLTNTHQRGHSAMQWIRHGTSWSAVSYLSCAHTRPSCRHRHCRTAYIQAPSHPRERSRLPQACPPISTLATPSQRFIAVHQAASKRACTRKKKHLHCLTTGRLVPPLQQQQRRGRCCPGCCPSCV